MKTILLTALTFTGIALCAPEAQARDSRHSSYRSGSSHYGHSSYSNSRYRSDCAPRVYSSHGHYSSQRYYYRPSSRYSYSERCEPVRRSSFRSPLLSFLFR